MSLYASKLGDILYVTGRKPHHIFKSEKQAFAYLDEHFKGVRAIIVDHVKSSFSKSAIMWAWDRGKSIIYNKAGKKANDE